MAKHYYNNQESVVQAWLNNEIKDYAIYNWAKEITTGNTMLYAGDTLVALRYGSQIYVKNSAVKDSNNGPARNMSDILINLAEDRSRGYDVQRFPFALETLFVASNPVILNEEWNAALHYALNRRLVYYKHIGHKMNQWPIHPCNTLKDLFYTKETVEILGLNWDIFLDVTGLRKRFEETVKQIEGNEFLFKVYSWGAGILASKPAGTQSVNDLADMLAHLKN